MTTPTTPTTPTSVSSVSLTEHTAASVAELLAMCEEFLRTAGPSTHAELRAYLDHQSSPADPCWFIDMLGFNVLHLGRQIPNHTPAPREIWQEVSQ